ncbi:MAG: non-canonical purine NTP pyrophosphatase [Myxococcota bacterium]
MSQGPARARWVLASHNPGKLTELRVLLHHLPVDVVAAPDLELAVPDETGVTFEENAAHKAVTAMKATGLVALADDSGVQVHALGGDPGVRTADWAGPGRDFGLARQRVQDALAAHGPDVDRGATWVTVLALATLDGQAHTFRGSADGTLVWPIRPDEGAGFEPMFVPNGYAITYSEMSAQQRGRVNARAMAMRQLSEALATFDT